MHDNTGRPSRYLTGHLVQLSLPSLGGRQIIIIITIITIIIIIIIIIPG